LPAIVRWKIRSWEDSDEYPDMLAQSYLLGWKAYLRAVSQGARSPVAVAAAFARYGPLEWLDCWLGHKGSLRQQYEHISLDSIYDEEALDWESALLTRLEAERLWRLVRQRCSDLEGEVLRRVILEGESYVKCSRAVGISRQRVSEIYYRALCKCREALR
jgi:DNA-directed RNA polymerase, sigma subunit (sigma70/sigma32)